MELIIYNPQIPELIEFNNEELIKELTEKLGHYNSLTYTDEEIKTAKADRATLNKFKIAIDNRRKEIKAQCMTPYNDFEAKVKQIISMIDRPILAIDTQVKTYEQRVRDEKRTEIISFYNDTVGALAELVPIEKVWIEKWLNVAENMKNIKEDIELFLTKARSDLEVISSLQSEFELQIRETYLKSLSLTTAMQEKTRLENQKAKQEAYNKAQSELREQARIKSEEMAIAEAERIEAVRIERESEKTHTELVFLEPEPVVETVVEPAVETVVETMVEYPNEIPVVEELKEIYFKAWVTPDLLEALESFLEAYEIKYERMS